MQRVRTNTCSMETLQHISDSNMDPKLQMQALQQVKVKSIRGGMETKDTEPKTKSKATKPRARKPAKSRSKSKVTTTPNTTPAEEVTQSTANTNASISEAKYQILMTALEKEIDQVAGDQDFGGLTPELKSQAQNGLSMLKQMMKNPAFMEKISAQLSKWSQQGSLPTPQSISAFIQEIIQLFKASVQVGDQTSDKKHQQFHHGTTSATHTKIFSESPSNNTNTH